MRDTTNTAAAGRMRLGWFANFLVPAWDRPWSGTAGEDWQNGDFYVDMARDLDRAGFDLLMLEDSSYVADAFGGTFEAELRHTVRAPKNDPVPLVPLLAQATERLGVIVTMSTSFYPPFLLARLVSTLDHLTHGRVGWNVVTSASELAAENFGAEFLPHDERYAVAAEFVSVVDQLWQSWEPDARVMDRESGTYVDAAKVHPIDHRGRYFQVRGPLNTLPPVQGRPIVCQAGGSPTGRDFAARTADVVLAIPRGIDEMKAYRDDIRARAAAAGRDPDDVLVLFMISPIVEATEELAQRRAAERSEISDERAIRRLLLLTDEIDFAAYDLDQPLPDVAINGTQSLFDGFKKWAGGRSLREAAAADEWESFPLVGTPATVADRMAEAHADVGGDGFLLFGGGGGMLTRRYIERVTEGLVPELRRRGLVREPTGTTLRERLFSA